MIFGESNIDQVVEAIDEWVDSFDFWRPGDDGSLGRDVAMKVVNGIIGRSNDKRGAQAAWAPNADNPTGHGYASYKEKRYGVADAANVRTGGMLSQKSLYGMTTIERRLVTMKYGTGQPPSSCSTGVQPTNADKAITDIEKAYFAHTGQSKKKILRPFYELDETISGEVKGLIAEELEKFIKEANAK